MSYLNIIDWNVAKDFASVLQSFGILIGIFIGGWWTYRLFVQNRQKYPRANLSHKISYVKLPNNKIYLQIKVIIANVGNVLICIESGFSRISQILPLAREFNNLNNSEREIEWPMLEKKEANEIKQNCEIEPGESDEICFDYLIDTGVEIINIYSYFSNFKKKSMFRIFNRFHICRRVLKKRDIGWQITTIYNLKEIDNV